MHRVDIAAMTPVLSVHNRGRPHGTGRQRNHWRPVLVSIGRTGRLRPRDDVFAWGTGVLVLHSTTSAGLGRIRTHLTPGTVVTTLKSTVDHVVTEYGVATSRGASLNERARRLIAIDLVTTIALASS